MLIIVVCKVPVKSFSYFFPANIYAKSAVKTLGKGGKYVQS